MARTATQFFGKLCFYLVIHSFNVTFGCRQVAHGRRRGPEQTHRVGTELPVLFGSSVRFGRASVQAQHELQVLVRFLFVCQRAVVVVVVGNALASTAARQCLVGRR